MADGQDASFAFTVRYLPSQPGAWILSTAAVNAAGQPFSAIPACAHQGQSCLASHAIRVAVTYQPASRYWAIQWTETAIYLALALTLAGYCSGGSAAASPERAIPTRNDLAAHLY